MTPFRGRPEFPDLVAAVRAGDAAAVDALWDLLEDCGATTADVMTLYACPPLPSCTCVGTVDPPLIPSGHMKWCPVSQYLRTEDDSLRPVLACWADRHGPPGRGADVRAWEVVRQAQGSGWLVQFERSPGDFFSVVHTAEWGARRELKRRVLGLFPDVRVPCPACGGRGDGEQVYCVPCDGSGAVAPAGLIPPELDRAHYDMMRGTLTPDEVRARRR